jgi:hypothetical protein
VGAIGGTARQLRSRDVPVGTGQRHARASASVALRPEARAADLLLRLLVGPAPTTTEFHSIDWGLLLRAARRGRVLVRATDRLTEMGVRVPHRFASAVADERHRVSEAIRLIRRVDRALRRAGFNDFLFLKAFRHYPDIASDVDLLTMGPADAVARAVTGELGLEPDRGLTARLAHATTYPSVAGSTKLDIHHGRLGLLGEHARYPAMLLRDRVRVTLPSGTFETACPEDQMVLQGMQRVYGRRSFKLADAVSTIHAIRDGDLDWDRVMRTARQTGTLPGLSCYLGFVDRIHRRTFGAPLLDPEVHEGLETEHWGRLIIGAGEYNFPARRVTRELYRRFVALKLRERDWRAAARVAALLPLAALGPAVRALGRRVRRRVRPAA